MKHSRFASALALSAFAILAGCQFIKVNGKPLGGGSSSPPPSRASAPDVSSDSGASSASSAYADSSPASHPAPTLQEPGKPAAGEEWCKRVGRRSTSHSAYQLADFENVTIENDRDPKQTAGRFADMMCTSGQVRDRAQIMALRDKWMKAHGLDERDFTALATMSRNLVYESQDETKIPGPLSQPLAGDELIALDELGTRASMFFRVKAVAQCFKFDRADPLLRNILCTREKLDAAKAYAEIDSVEELNDGTRYRLRSLVKETLDAQAARRARIAARAKEDPGIAKLVEIADAQFKEWASPSPKRAKLIQLVEAMEAAVAANKNSALAGCENTTAAAWEAHLASIQLPKATTERLLDTFVNATLDTAEGYLAYMALRLCAVGKSGFRHEGMFFVGSEHTRRGPRTATIAAWAAAAGDIKFDDRSLKLGTLLNAVPFAWGPRDQRPVFGVIEKIEEEETTATITFKRVVEPREDCLAWQETNRVEGIDSNGTLRYRQVCKKWGSVMTNVTPKPLIVTTLLARGLKPGMYLIGIEGVPLAFGTGGYAIVATANAKSTKPIWVLGGKVK